MHSTRLKHWKPSLLLTAVVAGGAMFSTNEARAGKEQFQRSKPHVNVGTIGYRQSRFTTRRRTTTADSEWRYVNVRRYDSPTTSRRGGRFGERFPFAAPRTNADFHHDRSPSRSWYDSPRPGQRNRGRIRVRLKSFDHYHCE